MLGNHARRALTVPLACVAALALAPALALARVETATSGGVIATFTFTSGRKFIQALNRLLRKDGYVR